MEDIITQGRLAALLDAGHTITYAEDTVIGDGWFADLRDGLGRVTESGGGHTQAAARAHLAERLERSEIPAPTAVPVPGPAIMHDHLTALLDGGYEVTLQSGGSVDGDEYYAHVRLGGGPLLTGGGKTPAEAIWTASPLHGDDEPFVATDAGALERDLEELWEYQSTLAERIHALEDRAEHRADTGLLVRMAADLFTRVFPDGLVAARGDKPGFSDDEAEHEAELDATAGALCRMVDVKHSEA